MNTLAPDRKNAPLSFGLIAVIVFFAGSAFLTSSNTRLIQENTSAVTRTHEVITSLDEILSLLKDAETAQRGYVITGKDSYLEPYTTVRGLLNKSLLDLEKLTQDNEEQNKRVPVLRVFTEAKLKELDETIELRRKSGFDAAYNVVMTDRGKNTMDAIRAQAAVMDEEEQTLRIERLAEMRRAYQVALGSGIITALLGIFLSLVTAFLIKRAEAVRRHQEWLRVGEAGLATAMLGDQTVEELGENVLKFLAAYFDAHVGAFFTKGINEFNRVSTYGLSDDSAVIKRFDLEEGLLGRAVKENRVSVIEEVPEGYLSIGSALIKGVPRHLLIAPAHADSIPNAVIELGFVHPLDKSALELLDIVSGAIGTAVRSANYRAHLQNLLEETQRQSEELQAQSEELRVSNEELEEQSRALKESQVRLEQQQAELEQTNSQLEEQTQLLETQRDDIERSKNLVQAKARELEQSSQYKSDFLANMSHELRTPLNSSLILAKLLADNPAGNLSDEQVKFAKTIQNSGNDLLSLINDILDLSKIEAGHMEVSPETVPIERIIKDMRRTFEPIAKQKNLTLEANISPDCSVFIETDRQRLEQILKNLLSNAIKFTEKGKVSLNVAKDAMGVRLSVTDTGIGISPDQQTSIFEAFRQADSTISRKYGGTGLGLSISRQLTRLLGGTIELISEVGKGSTFVLRIPEIYKGHTDAAPLSSAQEILATTSIMDKDSSSPWPQNEALPASRHSHIKDDRDTLTNGSRVILVIEDDESFAGILYTLAHEMNFQCLIAATAEEALILARQYVPSAVVLDVGLPDNSGLSVLDRMKRDVRTRHIPVHVVSANDYSQTAYSMGAVGYMIKPVKKDELVDALKNLEDRFSQKMHRVLIVEDDEVQRDSMGKLLGSHDVETIAVGTAAECLEKLKASHFDCMVLDLSLPDASGYSLLETLSKEESYSFPPVIVYTGRDLSNAEEQKLRKYSKSIIIKGAKSPERLLDEVSLFLHQVVSELPPEQQKMIEKARNRDAILEARRILVVEDDVANIYALTSILEPRGAIVEIARNGREALEALEKDQQSENAIDLVLMDMMMPEMDGVTATREIRKRAEYKKLPIIMLTAKAMKDDQERCISAGANDYMAKPLDVEKLLSLIRVWMPR